MNIRASIFGGTSPSDKSLLRDKKPKGAQVDSLDSLIEREQGRKSHSRAEDRHRLIDETVQLRRDGKSRDVQLVNLSGGGAMICTDVRLKLWDKVELHLGENGTIECAVRWVRDDRFGLEFAHETRIDCSADKQAAVLREVIHRSFPDLEFEADAEPVEEHDGPEGREERRHPLVWSGLLHHDYQSTPVRLRNISANGAMIDCDQPLSVGSEPLLELGDGLSISATIAWVIGDQAGLRFNSEFDLHDLARSRPEVAGSNWDPPAYLETGDAAGSPQRDPWGRMSIGQLRQDLEGFLKR